MLTAPRFLSLSLSLSQLLTSRLSVCDSRLFSDSPGFYSSLPVNDCPSFPLSPQLSRLRLAAPATLSIFLLLLASLSFLLDFSRCAQVRLCISRQMPPAPVRAFMCFDTICFIILESLIFLPSSLPLLLLENFQSPSGPQVGCHLPGAYLDLPPSSSHICRQSGPFFPSPCSIKVLPTDQVSLLLILKYLFLCLFSHMSGLLQSLASFHFRIF